MHSSSKCRNTTVCAWEIRKSWIRIFFCWLRICAFKAGHHIRRAAAPRHARRTETKRMGEEQEFQASHDRQRNLRGPVFDGAILRDRNGYIGIGSKLNTRRQNHFDLRVSCGAWDTTLKTGGSLKPLRSPVPDGANPAIPGDTNRHD